jgi:hypothetical protein
MFDLFSEQEFERILHLLDQAVEHRKSDIKYTSEIVVKAGTVKVYHMGKNNPVVRIDLKLNK